MSDPMEVFFTSDETGYIWYPFIKAICTNKDTTDIHYRIGNNTKGSIGDACVSPLLEYVPKTTYASGEDDDYSAVDINPYFRFATIFKDMLTAENEFNYALINDVIMHTLVNIDRICGMSKRDFLIISIIDEIDKGFYGSGVGKLFNMVEKRALAEILIMFYNSTDSISCMRALFKTIMTDFQIIIKENEEFVFYNPNAFDEQNHEKIKLIIKLFLPIGFSYVIHWGYSYGYIGYSESMNCEEFVL